MDHFSDANNPSDLIKELRKERENVGPSRIKEDRHEKGEFMDRTQLAEEMKETHGLRLKGNVLNGMLVVDLGCGGRCPNSCSHSYTFVLQTLLSFIGIREDQEVSALRGEPTEAEQMKMFLEGLSDKEKKKLMKENTNHLIQILQVNLISWLMVLLAQIFLLPDSEEDAKKSKRRQDSSSSNG
ncbi:unnamed protein product [Strongylus vulgaris]|uniref:Uncharacterized protein n=1 Tax=Strongylus vulgaris TaxID=40348 RepID=A0A3P7I0W0_STRVU|nr:unnamed protein product [Strongylus vulgaris]